jgi:hypothetical protein
MGKNFLSGALWVFCVTCFPLWGSAEEGEESPDNLELLEMFVMMTISTWDDNSPAFVKTQVREKFRNEKDPLYPNELKREGWEYIQGRLRMVRAKFLRSIEEVNSLMCLIQEIKDTPRPEGKLDLEANDCRLLVVLRDHLMNTIPRPRQLAGY